METQPQPMQTHTEHYSVLSTYLYCEGIL